MSKRTPVSPEVLSVYPRIALIGDVQGYAHTLEVAPRKLGADPDRGTLPEDLTVVQLGDLVHKGPDSTGCIAKVDRFFNGAPGQWIQLLGNHEAQYLGGFTTAPDLPEHLQSDLHRWSTSKQMRIALALETVELGPVITTHSGMTKRKWEAIGAPMTAFEAAHLLNEEWEREAGGELLKSWAGTSHLPFSQVHGHTSPYHWHNDRWRHNVPHTLLEAALVDVPKRRTEFTWPDGTKIIGIDPGFGGKGASVELTPFVLHLVYRL
jgi:hypothetical protein